MVNADFAYYYPEPYWHDSRQAAVKNLLLLFDGISVLVPDYITLADRMTPELIEPLEDLGKLEVIRPESGVTPEIANSISEVVLELVSEGAFSTDESNDFVALSRSRTGYGILEGVPDAMHEMLVESGLAKPSEDGVTIPMHRGVRFVYLFLLGQLSNGFTRTGSNRLHPALDGDIPRLAGAFRDFLDLPGMPSHDRAVVLAHDMQVLDIDLDPIPLDEVLSFKEDNRTEFVQYASNVRDFALTLSQIDDEHDRLVALEARELELLEASQGLRRRLRNAWTQPKNVAGFSLGAIGAAFSFAVGNPIAGALSGASGLSRMLPEGIDAGAYSYVVRAGRSPW